MLQWQLIMKEVDTALLVVLTEKSAVDVEVEEDGMINAEIATIIAATVSSVVETVIVGAEATTNHERSGGDCDRNSGS